MIHKSNIDALLYSRSGIRHGISSRNTPVMIHRLSFSKCCVCEHCECPENSTCNGVYLLGVKEEYNFDHIHREFVPKHVLREYIHKHLHREYISKHLHGEYIPKNSLNEKKQNGNNMVETTC